MSGAACAKIIIDNYGAYGGAGAEAWEVGKASCESMMQLYEDPKVSSEDRKALLALSAKACDWGKTMGRWNDELRDQIRLIAEKYL